MLEILEFIFSSFWVFAGCFLLVAVIGGYITSAVVSIFGIISNYVDRGK